MIYKDEGFSAKNIDRPEFKKMLTDADNKMFSHIICYRLDRISRNVGDFSKLIEKLDKINISLVCVKEQFDTSIPMGRAMMYMASVFAQLERETIAERVRDNMMMLSRYGQWLGGTTPLGFESYKIGAKSYERNSKYKFFLKEKSEEIKLVKEIYDKFLKYKSLTKIKKYLDSADIRSRNQKSFSIAGIKKILTNPVYCCADTNARNYFKSLGADVCFSVNDCNAKTGIAAYNKRNYCKNNGKINPVSNWIISLGTHKGVISGKNWVEVNKIINDKKYLNGTVAAAVLSEKIICKMCNSKMLIKKRKDSINFDYICSCKIYNSAKKCSCRNLSGRFIDKLIISQTVLNGLKNNCFFIKKLNISKNNISNSTDFGITGTSKFNFDVQNIIENICGNVQQNFINKIIKCIIWDNKDLVVKLKNCNN